MKFLADMGVSCGVVDWLCKQGHDAVHLREQQLQRLPDSEIFAKANAEGRVLLTFDLDFGEILALSSGKTISVVLFRLRNARTPNVISRLEAVLEKDCGALGKGAIILVEDGRHRVRELPIALLEA